MRAAGKTLWNDSDWPVEDVVLSRVHIFIKI